ncbi:MAG: DNA topoisomerase [Proteobacteria bacterium]|nr:DNA topoisomerase [Pseudomonadota bacterium]
MKKTLIIAEKPSVARDIVAALGGFSLSKAPELQSPRGNSIPNRGAQVWESATHICTHALGHLLDLYEPEDYHASFKTWKWSDLPIIPPQFLLKPKSETAPILRTIRQLLSRPDVGAVINACDAAREGELIFREIMDATKWNQEISRVWIQSMTIDGIRKSFADQKSGDYYLGLSSAAHGRSNADWLVGMNLSRAMTLKLSRASVPGVWSVGRVQTPTLAMLVDREFEILAHDPRSFQTLTAVFEAPDHSYEGIWFDAQNANFTSEKSQSKQIFDPEKAQHLIKKLTSGALGSVSESRTSREQISPRLFDLTALQRYMSNHHSWTAKRTLQVAQKCYEQFKIITYPRTESDCLPDDYRERIKSLFLSLSKISAYSSFALELQTEASWHNTERNFDSERVSDHFAIIPSGEFPNSLPTDESLLFDVIIRRTIASFMPPAAIDKVERTTTVQGEAFRSGPEEYTRIQGWQAATTTSRRKEGLALRPIPAGVSVLLKSFSLRADQTKPPPRISEAQLLSLMEHAGRKVEDPEMARALNAAGGLGTAATRAEIIENLKSKGFVFPSLQPTVKGIHLIRYLKLARAETLTTPKISAEFEAKLSQIEKGHRTKDLFLNEITQSIRTTLAAVDRFDVDVSFQGAPSLGFCPRCSNQSKTSTADALQTTYTVQERMWNYSCKSNFQDNKPCGFTLPKDLDGRYLDPATVSRLLNPQSIQDGKGIVVEGFPSNASPSPERRILKIHFGVIEILQASGQPLTAPMTPSHDQTSLKRRVTWGQCPIHVGDSCLVVETKQAFICETRLRHLKLDGKATTGLYLPKSLCGKTLKYDEINSFIKDGRTKKLEGFTSKGGKSFAAAIVRSQSGQWDLEFAR